MNKYNQEKVLCYIFKKLGFNKLDDTNDERIRQHKLIYLVQHYKLSLGLEYTWYVRGPYSPHLENLIQNIKDNNDIWYDTSIEKHIVHKSEVNKRLGDIKNLIGDHINDPLWLQVLTSVIYIRQCGTFDDVKKQLLKNQSYLPDKIKNFNTMFDEIIMLSDNFMTKWY